jgi:hypothetical protein
LWREELSEDFRRERDPWKLLNGSRNILDSVADVLRNAEPKTWDAHRRTLIQEQLGYCQAIIARLRLALTMLPPFDTDDDWAYAEEAGELADEQHQGLRSRKVVQG